MARWIPIFVTLSTVLTMVACSGREDYKKAGDSSENAIGLFRTERDAKVAANYAQTSYSEFEIKAIETASSTDTTKKTSQLELYYRRMIEQTLEMETITLGILEPGAKNQWSLKTSADLEQQLASRTHLTELGGFTKNTRVRILSGGVANSLSVTFFTEPTPTNPRPITKKWLRMSATEARDLRQKVQDNISLLNEAKKTFLALWKDKTLSLVTETTTMLRNQQPPAQAPAPRPVTGAPPTQIPVIQPGGPIVREGAKIPDEEVSAGQPGKKKVNFRRLKFISLEEVIINDSLKARVEFKALETRAPKAKPQGQRAGFAPTDAAALSEDERVMSSALAIAGGDKSPISIRIIFQGDAERAAGTIEGAYSNTNNGMLIEVAQTDRTIAWAYSSTTATVVTPRDTSGPVADPSFDPGHDQEHIQGQDSNQAHDQEHLRTQEPAARPTTDPKKTDDIPQTTAPTILTVPPTQSAPAAAPSTNNGPATLPPPPTRVGATPTLTPDQPMIPSSKLLPAPPANGPAPKTLDAY